MNFIQQEVSDQVKVCRVCLIQNVKMYDLRDHPLDTHFETVIGIPIMSILELPPYLCYECTALAKKYSSFKERCLKGQSVLFEILQNAGKITEAEINKIDRECLDLKSPFQERPTRVLMSGEISFKELDIQKKDIEHETVYNICDAELQAIKDEPNQEPSFSFIYELEVKNEDGDHKDIPDHQVSSDDEPLSLHKSNKKKKECKQKKRGRKTKKDKTDLGTQSNNVNGGDFPREEDQQKRRRGRPRKPSAEKPPRALAPHRTVHTGGVTSDICDDLEDYVTIVRLTPEEQMEEITKRKDSLNYTNAPFQCNQCYKGFIDTNAWNHHVAKHDPSSGDHVCPICKFRFPTRRSLQKHASNHEKQYKCKACPYISKTPTQAKQHQKWHKGVTYSCEYCDEVSSKWTSYLSHVRMKHPSSHICGACGYSFVSQLGLAMHKTMMHKDLGEKTIDKEEPGEYCAECEVQFVSREAYDRHMVTSSRHAQADDFSKGCRICGRTFPSTEALRLHHRAEHARHRPSNYGRKRDTDKWPTTCEHCGEQIANAREQWSHFRRVHPDKNYPIQKDYVCDTCGKSFRGHAFLLYHKRTHTEERSFKCDICGKAFYNRNNLTMHIKTHSEQRPYPCDVCFKAFKGKGALDRHYRCHTGVKPYECEVCGKAFGQSNSRKLHVRTVHLKQPAPYISRARLDRKRPPPPPLAALSKDPVLASAAVAVNAPAYVISCL